MLLRQERYASADFGNSHSQVTCTNEFGFRIYSLISDCGFRGRPKFPLRFEQKKLVKLFSALALSRGRNTSSNFFSPGEKNTRVKVCHAKHGSNYQAHPKFHRKQWRWANTTVLNSETCERSVLGKGASGLLEHCGHNPVDKISYPTCQVLRVILTLKQLELVGVAAYITQAYR